MKHQRQPRSVTAILLTAMALPMTLAAQQTAEATQQQIRDLQARLDRLERQQSAPTLGENVSFSGLVETEAGYADAPDGGHTSDLVLATVELGVQASLSDWIETEVLFLFEEDATPFDVDEGFIRLGNSNVSPLYLKAGRFYTPFGNYNTTLVSDPLTLELGETSETALQLGYEQSGLHAAIFTFNGDISEGGEDRVDQFGAQLGYSTEAMNAEVAYLSNLGDSDALQGALTSSTADYVGGVSAYLDYQSSGFTVIGEYVGATEAFDGPDLPFAGMGARPEAVSVEGSYATNIMGWPAALSLGYQETDEALALGLPESRALTGVSLEVHPQASLSLEWARDDDYDTDVSGTGEETDTVTLQLAAEF